MAVKTQTLVQLTIYKLNFVTERKSLLTGGQSVLENKEIM